MVYNEFFKVDVYTKSDQYKYPDFVTKLKFLERGCLVQLDLRLSCAGAVGFNVVDHFCSLQEGTR